MTYFGDKLVRNVSMLGGVTAVVYEDGSREGMTDEEWALATAETNPDLAEFELQRAIVTVKRLLPVLQSSNPRLQDLGLIYKRLSMSLEEYQKSALAKVLGDIQEANWRVPKLVELVGDTEYVNPAIKNELKPWDLAVWETYKGSDMSIGELLRSLGTMNELIKNLANKAVEKQLGTGFETARVGDLLTIVARAETPETPADQAETPAS